MFVAPKGLLAQRVIQERLEKDRRVARPETPLPLPDPSVGLPVAEEVFEEEELESLADALHRFWEQNIQPQFPNRSHSILSETMVLRLVTRMPKTEGQWFDAIPMSIRQEMDPRQREFLADILDVIAECG